MNIYNAIKEGSKILKKNNIKFSSLDCEILLAKALKKQRKYLILNLDKPLNRKNLEIYKDLINQRSNGKPIAYLIKKKDFWNSEFVIEEGALIPRPDTEVLIEATMELFKNKDYANVLDVGVGTGCIILSILKENTKYIADGFCSYCFALASFFTNDILCNSDDDVLYVDSDIIFYENIQNIINSAKGKSIGIHLHKHVPIGHHVGGYNVGVVYFKNDTIGKKTLKWWRDCVMDPKNEWYHPYGRIGDQAYLEAFESLFGSENIFIIDESIGHAAPWNMLKMQHIGNREIVWMGKKQLIHFIHFSQFIPNFEKDIYHIDRENGNVWGVNQLNNPHIKEYYDDYYHRLKKIKKIYKL